MKTQIVLLVAALCVPGFSQGRRVPVVTPSSNPVGRMTNPVQPIIQSPFMPHPATTPTGVLRHPVRGRNNVVVPVYAAPYFYQPYYSQPIPTVITIPGLPPGARYEDYRDTRYEGHWAPSFDTGPNTYSPPAPANTVTYEPEPRWIIHEPQPDRVVQPPAAGTARADVIKQFGEPWGRITIGGVETLYFDGVNVVIGADGRVTSRR